MQKLITVVICLAIMIGAFAIPLLLDPCIDADRLENDGYFTIIVPLIEIIGTTVIFQLFLPF